MVDSSRGEPDRGAATTRVPPEKQPMRPAIALAILSMVTVLMTVAGIAVVYVFAATGMFEDASWDLDAGGGQDLMGRILVVSLVIILFVAVTLGLKLASIVLGIIVVVRGDGKLRIGAALLLAVALLGMFFSVSLDGSMLSGTAVDVLTVLQWAGELARWGVTIAGIVILSLGVREVRRARARHPLGPR